MFDNHGYPMSPGGTVIRPPPVPPLSSPREFNLSGGPVELSQFASRERPEEPAKYIHELPKLQAPELTTSAVNCGNWLAQVRQVLVGLSPSASVWWLAVESAAQSQYQRWLRADPLDRLLLDPSGVYADFSMDRYQRVESRAVSLILAAIPGHIRDGAVSNRWLNTSSLIFRIMCLYQPGGASERSMLLSQLVSPEAVKSLSSGVSLLRRWQQHFSRVRELQAALPDSSLLLRGIDQATTGLLNQHPSLCFRVNAFRNRVALDYNPSISTVLQLVKLLQAEFESAALSAEVHPPDKRARAAAVQPSSTPVPPPPAPKVPNPKSGMLGASDPQAKSLEGPLEGKGKGKGKDKGKDGSRDPGVCYNFAGGIGCRYGDSCRFQHDKTAAKRSKRCMVCGQEGHFRSEYPLVAPQGRAGGESSGQSSSGVGVPVAKAAPTPKPKAAPQVKGVVEDSSSSSGQGGTPSEASSSAQEALIAEAAKLLKGVSLKPLRPRASEEVVDPGQLGISHGWLMSAVTNASDPLFALVDSGATNALRQAEGDELSHSKVISVDLASGATRLHINGQGTLLSTGLSGHSSRVLPGSVGFSHCLEAAGLCDLKEGGGAS